MSKRYSLCGDNILLFRENDFVSKRSEIVKGCTLEGIIIFVNIGDQRKFTSLVDDYQASPKKLHTNIDMLNGYTKGVAHTPQDANVQYISLMIKRDYLMEILPRDNVYKDFFNFFDKTTPIENFSHSKVNPKTQSLAYEILTSPYNDNLDKLYIESKTLELLHTEITQLFINQKRKANPIKFSNQDKEAIYHAKDILSKNISNPPSIKELCKMVAINELKLKRGFHEFFNETPYSLSLEYRLQESKKLLEKSDLNIGEISQAIGYKYIQSFSNTFYKRFGIRPKEIMKSRKEYYFFND